jgi:hypothetical protein
MDAVKEIIQGHGYDSGHDMDVGDHIKVEVDGYMPLTIEKIEDSKLSVAHYYTQRGDLMSDPEIVFRIDGDEWTPVRYTQHPRHHQYNENGLPSVDAFVNTWDRKLKQQGFPDHAGDETNVGN